VSGPQPREVEDHFDRTASYWERVYEEEGLEALIYQERRAAALAWIDDLALADAAPVLELGCGAGLATIALADRGFRVEAIDSSDAMVELTAGRIAEAGHADRVRVSRGDALALEFEPETFALVLALGVLPWVEAPERMLVEAARVARSGGYVLLTSDNRARLSHLLDPRLNPALRPVREGLKRALELTRVRTRRPPGFDRRLYSRRYVERLVAGAGLELLRSRTLGFGPFSLFERFVLPDRPGTRAHRALQRLADRDAPLLRGLGSHHLVLARKPTP
jgi:SAM-dependent methyltransferase